MPPLDPFDAAPPGLVFLLRLGATFAPPQEFGETPAGNRRILVVEKGQFDGPSLRGVLRTGGGDWALVRRDGVAELDIRLTLETEDQALIYARGNGVFDMAPEIRQALLAGEQIDRGLYYFRTAWTFETGASQHASLSRLIAVGVGERTAAGMITDIFAVQ
jgi:hypothetical protein